MTRISPLELLHHPTAVSLELLEQAAEELNGSRAYQYTQPAKPRNSSNLPLWRLNRIRGKRGLQRLTELPEQLQERKDPRQVVEEMLGLLGIEA